MPTPMVSNNKLSKVGSDEVSDAEEGIVNINLLNSPPVCNYKCQNSSESDRLHNRGKCFSKTIVSLLMKPFSNKFGLVLVD